MHPAQGKGGGLGNFHQDSGVQNQAEPSDQDETRFHQPEGHSLELQLGTGGRLPCPAPTAQTRQGGWSKGRTRRLPWTNLALNCYGSCALTPALTLHTAAGLAGHTDFPTKPKLPAGHPGPSPPSLALPSCAATQLPAPPLSSPSSARPV